MKPAGLYVDFPFCLARCSFCAFNIQGYREGLAERYLAALRQEILLQAEAPIWQDRMMTSIYFGGGTPTLYPPSALVELLSLCRVSFPVAADVEVTLEAHPATIDLSNLDPLRKGGINRLSMGVQSFSDAHLEALGRHHTAEAARQAFHAARAAGFENIGIDLIYALPGHALAEWEATLQSAIELAPEHLSLYCLSVEEGTLFHKKEKQGLLSLPSEPEVILLYQTAQGRLKRGGYEQYEISNFARPGFACRHNLHYWNRNASLGIGLSAHSYLVREHRANTDSLPGYLDQIASRRIPIAHTEKISFQAAMKDRIIFGLRKSEGIPLRLLARDLTLEKTSKRLIEEGLLIQDADRLRLSSKGILLADEVAIAFL
jgi:oxygen-independent coproporphyrinogen III oxidase